MEVQSVSSDELLELSELYKEDSGTVLFFSKGPHIAAKQSFLCRDPIEKLTLYPEKWTLLANGRLSEGLHTNPWDTLASKMVLSQNSSYADIPEWVGYLTYEMGAWSDQKLPFYPPSIPLAQFFKCRQVFHAMGCPNEKPSSLSSIPETSSEKYSETIRLIQQEIRQGDVYQVNLSHERRLSFIDDSYKLFRRLIEAGPSPFAAFFKSDDFSLICSSPERLLQKKGDCLETRPIKGTAPRGRTVEEDALLAKGLLNSEKDRAELLMITDLMRNDLGKVSTYGSIKVKPLIELESYANVFHLISRIQSQCKKDLAPVEFLRAVFPGGSITGCPKMNAMKSITHHEKRARGIYTGSIGYFTSTGNFDFNIAIRTLLHQNNMLSWALGGAIVSDSIPENEYKETLHKGATIFHALKALNQVL